MNWIVILRDQAVPTAYGPLGEVDAKGFAAFLTAQVDPAVAVKLASPVAELLSWYVQQPEEDEPETCPSRYTSLTTHETYACHIVAGHPDRHEEATGNYSWTDESADRPVETVRTILDPAPVEAWQAPEPGCPSRLSCEECHAEASCRATAGHDGSHADALRRHVWTDAEADDPVPAEVVDEAKAVISKRGGLVIAQEVERLNDAFAELGDAMAQIINGAAPARGPEVDACDTCGGVGDLQCAAHVAGDGCVEMRQPCPDCGGITVDADPARQQPELTEYPVAGGVEVEHPA